LIQFDFSYYIYGHIHDIRKLIWIDRDHVVMASPVFLMDLIKRILQGKISMSLSYEMETSRAWQTYLAQINQVTPYLEEDLIPFVNTLKRPKRALIVDVPIVMDDGSIQHFDGYRVQHKLSRCPCKDVTRHHPMF